MPAQSTAKNKLPIWTAPKWLTGGFDAVDRSDDKLALFESLLGHSSTSIPTDGHDDDVLQVLDSPAARTTPKLNFKPLVSPSGWPATLTKSQV